MQDDIKEFENVGLWKNLKCLVCINVTVKIVIPYAYIINIYESCCNHHMIEMMGQKYVLLISHVPYFKTLYQLFIWYIYQIILNFIK